MKTMFKVGFVLVAAQICLAIFTGLHVDKVPVMPGWTDPGTLLPRWVGAFIYPGLTLLTLISPYTDNFVFRRRNVSRFDRFYPPFFYAIALYITLLQIHATLGGMKIVSPHILQFTLITGVFFLGVGNVLPRASYRSLFFLPFPWIFKSEETWRKFHRLIGFAWFVAGVLLIVTSLLGLNIAFHEKNEGIRVAILAISGLIMFPIPYSYFIHKKEGTTGALSIIAALVFLSSISCSGADEKSKPKLVLDPCSHEIEEQKDLAEEGALCGKYEVWEDREGKKGRKIALNVAVIPSLAKAKPDPVFLLAGGPGGAATESPWMLLPWVKKLRLYRDIVLVDQRGTGSSNPLDCLPDGGLPFEELFRPRRPNSEIAKCVEGYDADLTKYTTDIAMDDLDEIRDALGYDKINLYGGSYGTRAALVYLRRHEATVRSLVIETVAPMEMRLIEPMAEDGERAIGLLLTHCENDDGCKEAFPNLRQKLSELIARLKEKPAEVQLNHPRTGQLHSVTVHAETLRMILFGALYDTPRSALIPLAIDKAHGGDFSVFGALLELSSGNSEYISSGMQLAVLCNEDLALVSEELADAGPLTVFSRNDMVSLFKEHCDFFQGAAKPESYFEPVKSEVPTLVLSGDLDPVTPPRWGEIASKDLKDSKHVVVPGMGHGVSMNRCVSNMIVEHIENASPASIETDCLKGIKRFPVFIKNTGPIATDKKVKGQ